MRISERGSKTRERERNYAKEKEKEYGKEKINVSVRRKKHWEKKKTRWWVKEDRVGDSVREKGALQLNRER